MMAMSEEPKRSFTVLELNTVLKEAVEGVFAYPVWVIGEVQDLKVSSKRNIYFTMTEKDDTTPEPASQMQAFIFENNKARILAKLKTDDLASFLKNGIEVRMLCKISYYAKSSRASLTVLDIDPDHTLGKIALDRERLVAKLTQEGVLVRNKRAVMSDLPLSVALITAQNTAAYHDFVDELTRSGYPFKVLAFDAHMQGPQTEGDVVSALSLINRFPDRYDAVVITRGGGSTADLSVFDSEKIVRAAAVCQVPVLAAIGHQTNTSVLELAAFEQHKTPTKAARALIERVESFVHRIDVCQDAIFELPVRALIDARKDVTVTLSTLFERSTALFAKSKHRLIVLESSLRGQSERFLERKRTQVDSLQRQTALLDPHMILERGFSITKRDGKIVRAAEGIEEGDRLETVFADGIVRSTVGGTVPIRSSARRTLPPKTGDARQLHLFDSNEKE
jgi:exodeoxyribonuclease VII large subunit